MSFYEQWVELDLNPVMSFNNNGKILYTNNEAQFLLNRINPKKLFDLTMKYASKNFGVKTSYIDLTIQNYIFYAISVMYENENEIHLKLYKSVMVKKEASLNIKNVNNTNIFTLIDLAISSNKIKNNKINFIKNYDPSIPEFKLNASSFIKVLNEIFEIFNNTEEIVTIVKLKAGEYIRIDNKKYSLVSVIISSSKNIHKNFTFKEDSFVINIFDNKVEIDLPLVV